jgi:RHS repeat-associated protein
MKVGGQYYFYQNDHLGTPQKMTAVNGAVVWSAKYSSFGKAEVDSTSSVTNNFRFSGQYYDAETGNHYNYHRYFDPKNGRYLRSDPIGIYGGINLYTYALNNPTSFYDSLGLQSEDNCSDCESGEWIIDQGGTGSISFGYGYSRTVVEFRCKGGTKKCHAVFECHSAGFQANVGFQWNIDIKETYGTGSIIKGIDKSSDLGNYRFESWTMGAFVFSTSGNNIAIGPSVGWNFAYQWCSIDPSTFWCE